jgi:nicotinamide-nucleotide amidase
LEFRPEIWQELQKCWHRLGRNLAANNRIQAMIPKGAAVLPNPHGTAAGFCLQAGKRWVAALPGPPRECLPMLSDQLLPRLATAFRRARPLVFRCQLRACGVPESELQAMLGPIFASPGMPELGFLLDEPGEILVILTMRGAGRAEALRALRQGSLRVRKALGANYVGAAGAALPAVVGRLLAQKHQTLAVAESCTGGLICRRLTSIPGSSRYFLEGAVTYGNASKISRLGVPQSLLAKNGAVSEVVAKAMAAGLQRRSRADWTVAVTGIAGPGGGTRSKPVGTVCFAWSAPDGRTFAQTQHFWGDRDHFQRRSATAALDILRRAIMGNGE